MGAIPQLSDAELGAFAASAGASQSNWTWAGALKFMRNRRMDYYRKTPGDCGTQTNIDLGAVGSITSGVKLAGTAAGGTAAIAGTFAAGGAFAGAAALAATGVGLVLAPLGILFGISAHHAAAVKAEQDTLCAVTNAYNQFADQIEAGLSSGQTTVEAASAALDQVHAKLDGAMAAIAKEGNAGWGFRIDLSALVAYNKAVVYPALAEGGALGGKTGWLILGGGGLAAAKLGGLF